VFNQTLRLNVAHAWENRTKILQADVIWTHTENEFLAVVALLVLAHPWGQRPKVIGQSVWLADNWDTLPALRRTVYRAFLQRVDLLTTLSPNNREKVQQLASRRETVFVPFGISHDSFPYRTPKDAFALPLHIATLGNDQHRDWETFLMAAQRLTVPHRVRIASVYRDFPSDPSIELLRLRSLLDIHALYDWAHVIVVPLRSNLHASGITVILEAVASGIPVIATRTGGLEAYFTGEEITYYQTGDAKDLIQRLEWVSAHYAEASAKAIKAQAKMRRDGYTSDVYAHRYVELTERILSD
jgi:glycosyltransferase involved in cell wall biosynthesis